MRKRFELIDPRGCMFRASDAAAPLAIRAWVGERIRLGKNQPNDPQILEAEECARTMEAERNANP